MFHWPQSLRDTTGANCAILQIANLRLIYLFSGVAVMCFVFPVDLQATALGRAFLLFMSLFWVGRVVEQLIFLRINRPALHLLTALFLLGAILFALPLR